MKTLFLFFALVIAVPQFGFTETTTSKKSSKRSGKSRKCPFGRGPMRHAKCPSAQKNRIILEAVGNKKAADCYSKLFVAESTNCSVSLHHDPKKAKNPHVGFGICAIESSPAVRRTNGRGPNCRAPDIYKSFKRQVLCCRDMVQKTRSRYFGTILCGKTPNCFGLSRRGSGDGNVSGSSSATPDGSVCYVNKPNSSRKEYVLASEKRCRGQKIAPFKMSCKSSENITLFAGDPRCSPAKTSKTPKFLCPIDGGKFKTCWAHTRWLDAKPVAKKKVAQPAAKKKQSQRTVVQPKETKKTAPKGNGGNR